MTTSNEGEKKTWMYLGLDGNAPQAMQNSIFYWFSIATVTE